MVSRSGCVSTQRFVLFNNSCLRSDKLHRTAHSVWRSCGESTRQLQITARTITGKGITSSL